MYESIYTRGDPCTCVRDGGRTAHRSPEREGGLFSSVSAASSISGLSRGDMSSLSVRLMSSSLVLSLIPPMLRVSSTDVSSVLRAEEIENSCLGVSLASVSLRCQ